MAISLPAQGPTRGSEIAAKVQGRVQAEGGIGPRRFKGRRVGREAVETARAAVVEGCRYPLRFAWPSPVHGFSHLADEVPAVARQEIGHISP